MHGRAARPTVVLALAAATLACSDADADRAGGGAAAIEDIGATEIGRIGSLDDPEQSLTRVGDVVIGPGERLYVAQPADLNIRLFDSTDAAAGTIGREGEGPGEFQGLPTIGRRGDTLYAFDTGGPRVSYFAADGTHLRSRRGTGAMIRAGGTIYMIGFPQAFALLPDGGGVVRPGYAVAAAPRGTTSTHPILRVDSALRVVDTVTLEVVERRGVEIARGGTTYRVVSPFEDHPLTTILPDGGGVAIVDRRVPTGSEPAAFRHPPAADGRHRVLVLHPLRSGGAVG